MNDIDIDNMTDEQVDQMLNDIQTGKFGNATSGSEDENTNNNDEDTANVESTVASTETNDMGDGSNQETEEEEEDEGSENTLVDQTSTENEEEENASVGSEDVGTTASATIDTSEFERYKKFYDQVANVEFMANGKKVKGFTDPQKIIQAQQMAYGFSSKMAAVKEYRPFLTTLKERGILENPDKFNFAMDLLDGDPEALKAHMQALKVDPLDLDMDTVKYSSKNHITSKEALVLEDTIEQAKNYGVEDKLRATIGKEWDPESFNEFLTVPEVRKDLLEHMATGAFDLVQDKIAEMKTLDYSGTFGAMKSTDQYRQAVQALTAEASRIENNLAPASNNNSQSVAPKANVDKSAELAAKQEAEYKRNLETKNRLAEDARKKASSVSKKKGSTTEVKKFDPLQLEGKELDDFVNSLIRG